MSVLSHLTSTASNAVLSSAENSSIATSISSLQEKIKSYFGTAVSEHFKFGSYTRDTILPRKIDESSDVDYMIVFKDGTSKPQTYLDRLKKFVEGKYSRSEIYQSNPTIVLELSHIRFELVPALANFSGYNIPAPASNWSEWIVTYPLAFGTKIADANKTHSFQLKPLIRLIKYWNAQAGRVYSSYELEQKVVDHNPFTRSTLKDYVYSTFDALSLNYNESQWRKDKLQRAKDLINAARNYERQDLPTSAEIEIKKLFPVV